MCPAWRTLFWREGSTIIAAITTAGATQPIIRPVAPGNEAAAVYSAAGRLHLVYSQAGALY